jgi:hypothetical protein
MFVNIVIAILPTQSLPQSINASHSGTHCTTTTMHLSSSLIILGPHNNNPTDSLIVIIVGLLVIVIVVVIVIIITLHVARCGHRFTTFNTTQHTTFLL